MNYTIGTVGDSELEKTHTINAPLRNGSTTTTYVLSADLILFEGADFICADISTAPGCKQVNFPV